MGALVATYLALLAVLGAAALALKSDLKKFALAFTAVFFIAYASWIVGSYANFAAVTPAELQKFGITWSLKLTNEGGYIFALLAGLVIANVFPRFAENIKDAVRPELYIKIAIVILGGVLRRHRGRQARPRDVAIAARRGRHRRGLPDLLGAGLSHRPHVSSASAANGRRRWPPASRSAASRRRSRRAAQSGRVRSVPIVVSSLVVIFAVVEVLILPFIAQTFLYARADGGGRLDGACG